MTSSYKITVNSRVFDVTVDDKKKVIDSSGYEKTLESILELSQKEFITHVVDLNRHQIIVGRNNLWVAAAMIGSYAALFNKFGCDVDILSSLGNLFSLAFVLAVIAFGLCLYGMPSRKGYAFVYKENWTEIKQKTYEQLKEGKKGIYLIYLDDLIKRTDEANMSNKETNSKRGKIFRITSWLLICSFLACFASGLIYVVNVNGESKCSGLTLNTENLVRCIMSDEENELTIADIPTPETPSESEGERMLLDSVQENPSNSAEVLNED